MNKINTSSGIPVFGQLISLIPKNKVFSITRQYNSDYYTKKFKTWDHLITMLFASLANCNGLRELESGLAGFHTRLLHLGISWLPRRSTLSDANIRRSSEVFESIFKSVYKRVQPFLPDSFPKNQKWMEKLFLVDSTTITLFKEILKACGRTPANGKRKGGVKIHVGMHLSESTPSLVRVTSAATSDKNFMIKFKNIEPETIIVFDKAYVNYKLYNHWTKSNVIFVTRLHSSSIVNVIHEKRVSPDQQAKGVYREQIVELGHSTQKEKVICRLIYFYDKLNNRVLKFITNDMEMASSLIAQIYKQRWQIELLFKRLKQNLQFSSFLGDNENAIRIQIWTNLIADLLLTLVRKGMKKRKAYSNVAALIRIHIMNYVKIIDLLTNPGDITIFASDKSVAQLTLNLSVPP